ncbi:glycosyltransferase family 2 protein [Qipengyuania sp. RANM35]|uniref:glycosyltransferase family 2 protein n=1 Tax=Qipengyuania sp. RANM35 TaxID=3068635 RepID=UPI0034DB18D0
MRIHVAIATTGRPAIVRRVVDHLSLQERRADGIVVVGASREDIAGLEGEDDAVDILLSDRGLCKQRNTALRHIGNSSDVVVFIDDDFVPARDFLRRIETLFRYRPEVVGATGVLVADGAHTSPIGFEDAVHRLDVLGERPPSRLAECQSLYGCNMAIRLSAAEGLKFDERLPLYGWQEDVDFTYQLGWRGTLVKTSELTGIHMGSRSGKTSGLRLGYSQVANIAYLLRKGTIRGSTGRTLMMRNITANAVRSLWPEKDIDRRGRLAGNFIAARDVLRGRIDPERIEAL